MDEITEKITALLAPILEETDVFTDVFVVSIKVKPVNNIKVFLDADSGFPIEKAVAVNRKLYAAIEMDELFPDGDFSLEVSSPGVDEPLTGMRQYAKNKGRKVAVTTNEGIEKIGMLTEVTDTHITLEIKGKKAKDSSTVEEIPFTAIKSTVVQIIF